MPSLDEIRSFFKSDSKGIEEKKTKFNGKLNLHNNLLARALFIGLPAPAKFVLRNAEGICIAGGYIRDKLNGTPPGDIDFWGFGKSDQEVENAILHARVALDSGCSFKFESKHSYTYSRIPYDYQIMKRISRTPYGVIDEFDFFCCKFALYMKNGKPCLLENSIARESALEKILEPIEHIEDYGATLRHLSKLHRKGYTIEEKWLYHLLAKYELTKPDDYSEKK